jgi:hypothetical protein
MIAARVLHNLIEARHGRPAPTVSITFVSLSDGGAVITYPFCKCTSSSYHNNTLTVALLNADGTAQLDDNNKPLYRCISRPLIIDVNGEEVML